MESKTNVGREFRLTVNTTQMMRIDKFLVGSPGLDVTRSALNKLFDDGAVSVNGTTVKKSIKVRNGQEIRVLIPPQREEGTVEVTLNPTNIPLDIVYEDEYLAVINKQSGLVVHPGEGEENEQTLVNALLFRYGIEGLSSGENASRPGIVHRLDKDTSGCMLICKNNQIHAAIKDQFQQKTIRKCYHALVVGKMKEPHGVLNGNIMRHPKIHHKMIVTQDPNQGKVASTEYQAVKIWKSKNCFYTLLEIQLHTGRTHQIRVHMASDTHPIVGDVLYHKRNAKHKADQLCLVAKKLSFFHPKLEKMCHFEVDYPTQFKEFMEYLDKTCVKEDNPFT